MQIDFDDLKIKIEAATKKAFIEIIDKHKDQNIYAFALYSDDGAMTVCPSSNTLEYLENADEDDLAYYKFTPFEWEYEMEGADKDFSAISKTLYQFHEKAELNDDEFETFRAKLYDICIDVLKKLKEEQFFFQIAGKEIFLTFEASDYEFEQKKMEQIITDLNANEYKEEYLSWMKTWR